MEQRDYILRQIDQLGQVLVKLLSSMLNQKTQDQTKTSIEHANQVLQKELNFNFYDIASTPIPELIPYLQKEKKLNNENLGYIADILYFIADNINKNKIELYQRSLEIFEYLEMDENVYSYDRNIKIKKILQKLN